MLSELGSPESFGSALTVFEALAAAAGDPAVQLPALFEAFSAFVSPNGRMFCPTVPGERREQGHGGEEWRRARRSVVTVRALAVLTSEALCCRDVSVVSGLYER